MITQQTLIRGGDQGESSPWLKSAAAACTPRGVFLRSRIILGKTKPTSLLRSKNTFLADLPPASEARGKSVGGFP